MTVYKYTSKFFDGIEGADAQLEIGINLFHGANVTYSSNNEYDEDEEIKFEVDYPAALSWFTKAESQGIPLASFYMALMHYAGLGTEKDIAKALTSLSKAVDAGVPFSKTVSGLLMQEIGRTDLAVDLLFEDAKSSNPLSIILFQNSLVEKSTGTTQNSISNLFTSASNSAHLLDKMCENDAFEVAKTFFENSPIFKQAFTKAIDILTPLANFGDTGSQELLGWLYNKGVGVEKNVDLSISFFLKAGQKNSDFAHFNLYKISRNENQTLITRSEAYKYLEKAAENNYLPAILEIYYDRGFEEEENLELLRYAADKGDLGAIENLVRSYHLDSNEKLKYLLKGADSGSKKVCLFIV